MGSEDPGLALKLENVIHFERSKFRDQIFLVDLSPSSTFQLLVEEWKMGPNLARTFIDHFGGHLLDLYCSLEEFSRTGDSFDPYLGVDWRIEESLQRMINENPPNSKLFEILRDLAVKGYHYIDYDTFGTRDALIQSICLQGIAMLLTRDYSGIPDFPMDIWNFERENCFSLEDNSILTLFVAASMPRIGETNQTIIKKFLEGIDLYFKVFPDILHLFSFYRLQD
jgi:hypothetical protein